MNSRRDQGFGTFRQRRVGRRWTTIPIAGLGSVLLHGLLFLPFVTGFSAKRVRMPDAQGAGASAIVSTEEPVMTLILINDPSLNRNPDSPPDPLSSRGWVPSKSEVVVLSPDSLPVVDLTGVTIDPKSAEKASEAAGDTAGHALMFGRYMGQIAARVERAWIRPRDAISDPLFRCRVQITQDRVGNVKEVVLQQCNGDARWQQSLATAIQAASPLSAPPDPSVFVDALTLTFDSTPFRRDGSTEGFEPEVRVANVASPLQWASATAMPSEPRAGVIDLRIIGTLDPNSSRQAPDDFNSSASEH